MKETRRKNSIKYRVGKCDICGIISLCQRHHILDFNTYGESSDGYTLALCASCHELLHTALNAIVHKKKRSSEVWETYCNAVGRNHSLVKKIEDRVYETAEIVLETEFKYYDT